jgi:RHS repeat-associated protein
VGTAVETPGLPSTRTCLTAVFCSDRVGSTRYLSESTGLLMPSALRYDAFGQRTALAGPNYPTPYQFAGGWGYEAEYSDATEPYLGLAYVDQRYYEPATGRFISPDPIGFDGGLNLFAYCDNDPVNSVDPDGLYGIWVGGVHLGDDHPWLVFDAQGAAAGLGTGVAAVGSAGSFGLWDGGDAQCQPGFGTSRALAAFGRDILLWEAGGALLGRAAPLLSRIPRPALRLRPGFLRLPGLGSGGGQATGQWHHVLSRKIWREAVQNPALRAALQRNSPRFLAQARDLVAHKGYQQWHRALDDEIVEWLRARPTATVDEFVQHLRDLYAHPSLQHRFPGYPGP